MCVCVNLNLGCNHRDASISPQLFLEPAEHRRFVFFRYFFGTSWYFVANSFRVDIVLFIYFFRLALLFSDATSGLNTLLWDATECKSASYQLLKKEKKKAQPQIKLPPADDSDSKYPEMWKSWKASIKNDIRKTFPARERLLHEHWRGVNDPPAPCAKSRSSFQLGIYSAYICGNCNQKAWISVLLVAKRLWNWRLEETRVTAVASGLQAASHQTPPLKTLRILSVYGFRINSQDK